MEESYSSCLGRVSRLRMCRILLSGLGRSGCGRFISAEAASSKIVSTASRDALQIPIVLGVGILG